MLKQRLILTTLILVSLLGSGSLFASPESEKKKQLALLRERMQLVEKNIALTQQSKTKEEKALKQLDKRLAESSKRLRLLNEKLDETDKKIKQLRAQQARLKEQTKVQKQLLAEQLKSAYLMGKQQRVKMLLNQQHPDRMSRVIQYYDYFNQARLDNVTALDAGIKKLIDVEVALDDQLSELATFIDAKKTENEQLMAAKSQRKKVLAQLGKEMKSAADELAELKENEKRLTTLLASIRQVIIDTPVLAQQNKPFKSLKGRLPWPIKGSIRKRFGSARQSGRYDGVVIAASEGTAIKAISHGRVVYADWLRGYGLLIIVDHGSNYMSLYAFNEGLYKEVGDWVEAGEMIATVGVSGGQQKAGLYFSIRKNGKPVNPIQWCRAVKKGRVG
ncbi:MULTISPECIES: murein hydrolase activator EnvC [Cycloclasticus]|uniref:Peptidase M23B n=1 Tax=Cycloclasticus pugetii TaxID=34068 RepID=A0AB33Z2F9_9GAMM|nr:MULTISPECIES: peptidoglycan DD-metalloendopeptidase family protein [Cycloclasticus]ATI02146.1 peptidase M23 [Cycloclasticus sp. PY97N]EPD13102.1 peptidase M23B [Cycloclasticus pugetii]